MAGRRSFGQIYQKGSTYYVRTRLHGVTRIRRVGPDKKVAEDFLADLRAKMAKEEALGVRFVAPATLAEVWRAAAPARRARLAPRWFRYHERHIQVAIDHFGERLVKDLGPTDIEDFLAHLATRGCRPSTARRYLASLSPVLEDAVRRGLARVNPAAGVKRPRLVDKEVPFLGEPEIQRLVAAATPEMRPVVLALADTGLRRGELLSLEWRDIDLPRGTVLVRKSKTGRGREVPLTARARAAFEEVRAARTAPDGTPPLPDAPVFEGYFSLLRRAHTREGHVPGTDRDRLEALLTIRIRRLARKAGLPGVSPHSLRHSFASRMVVAGVPLSFVARVTGHSTLTCAARYGKHAPTDAGKLAIRALEAATAEAGGAEPGTVGATGAPCGAVPAPMATVPPAPVGAAS